LTRFTASLLAAWALSLIALLHVNPHQLSWWGLLLAMLVRTLLQTGLFIIGHDAMHGVLWPSRRRWNDAVGGIALALYAALPYERCRRKHQRHHSATATARDPDFCADRGAGVLGWYFHFMEGYLSWRQMACLLSTWAGLALAVQAGNPWAWINVLLFCTVPLLLSSLQLFFFGTYLPHRQQRWPRCDPQPSSLDLPVWLSLLACFHFGYHREHHDHPNLRWFELPGVRAGQRPLTLDASVR
jgi:beta-carotene/zeaxanthin 4-ketolase